jgi:nucleoside-diphosphate-sugar epimerase
VNVFVTGASGQVGRSLIFELLRNHSPDNLYCLVRNPENDQFLQEAGVNIVEGALNDQVKIMKVFHDEKIEIVYHIAAISDPSVEKNLIFSTNIDGSRNILECFIKTPTAHCFVFSSSISVYDSYLKPDGNKIKARWQQNQRK